FYDPVMEKLIRCCDAEFREDQRLKNIDRVRDDDPTHEKGMLKLMQPPRKKAFEEVHC
ncbi:hypothetical protein A2U01_0071249, partial [Trifolium medium]|nr:hypothetical protein [Trifolium medium]